MRDSRGHELHRHVLDGLLGGFSEDCLPVLGRAHRHLAETGAAPAAAAAAEQQAAARRDALTLGARQDLARARVDDADGQRDGGLSLRRADLAEAEPAAAPAAAADVDVLLLGAELRDGPDDQELDAEHLAHLGHDLGVGVSAIAVREVLLGQQGVEPLAFDDAVGAVVDQLVHDEIGDALADVPVTLPPSLDASEVEVQDRDRRPRRLALRDGRRRNPRKDKCGHRRQNPPSHVRCPPLERAGVGWPRRPTLNAVRERVLLLSVSAIG